MKWDSVKLFLDGSVLSVSVSRVELELQKMSFVFINEIQPLMGYSHKFQVLAWDSLELFLN